MVVAKSLHVVRFTIYALPEAIPKGLNVNNHPENSGWDENTRSP